MQRITETFLVHSASKARFKAVLLQQQIRISKPGTRRPKFVNGAAEYRLADGRQLILIDEVTFEIATTGERLTRA
jgi:hypothetical protein